MGRAPRTSRAVVGKKIKSFAPKIRKKSDARAERAHKPFFDLQPTKILLDKGFATCNADLKQIFGSQIYRFSHRKNQTNK